MALGAGLLLNIGFYILNIPMQCDFVE